MTVFVVEESPALAARLLERLQLVPELSVSGVARNVMEAIRVIPILEPDLVITDTESGHGGGLALLHVLQARRAIARRGPRVLLWTECSDPQRRAVAEGLGAEARFDKACEVELLVDYCRQAAKRHE
jgi:DNA-binding NarL/FixJ family response regulator